MKTIKVIHKTPIKKLEDPNFSFKRTHEALVRNRKILAAFNGDFSEAIVAQKDIPVNYGLELRDTASIKNHSSITRTGLRSST